MQVTEKLCFSFSQKQKVGDSKKFIVWMNFQVEGKWQHTKIMFQANKR